MKMSKHRSALVAAIGTVVVVIVVVVYPRGPQPARLTIATATEGGTYFALGKQLARILENLPGEVILEAEAALTDGSRDNIERLCRPLRLGLKDLGVPDYFRG